MVESLLIVVLLTSLLFGTLSICVMVMNDMLSYEAAFSAARVAAVSRGDQGEIDRRAGLASAVLLAGHTSTVSYIPCGIKTDNNEGRQNTELSYMCRVLFSSLISPFDRKPFSSLTRNMVKRETSVRMIRSPDEGYYDKAYNGAKQF